MGHHIRLGIDQDERISGLLNQGFGLIMYLHSDALQAGEGSPGENNLRQNGHTGTSWSPLSHCPPTCETRRPSAAKLHQRQSPPNTTRRTMAASCRHPRQIAVEAEGSSLKDRGNELNKLGVQARQISTRSNEQRATSSISWEYKQNKLQLDPTILAADRSKN